MNNDSECFTGIIQMRMRSCDQMYLYYLLISSWIINDFENLSFAAHARIFPANANFNFGFFESSHLSMQCFVYLQHIFVCYIFKKKLSNIFCNFLFKITKATVNIAWIANRHRLKLMGAMSAASFLNRHELLIFRE